ncbi:MAG TPA: hypothetical protein VG407_16570 [Caulobacteraceae bacterium]|jgi:hypothetical protein|nr:hypothetical protein [Caulobacteraceae bacterium]
MIKAWATGKVDWRGPASLWVALAWLLAVLWPPLPLTLIFWPSNNTGLMTIKDPRAVALILGAVSVTVTLMMIDRERKRDGTPRTRLGVLMRFIGYGFVFTVIAVAALAIVLALMEAFSYGDLFRRMGEAKATMWVALVMMPLILLAGVSYTVWSGVVTSLIAFGPRPASVRPRHFLMEQPEIAASPVVTYSARPVEPEPAPPPPHPETDVEAALRPEID